MDRLQDPEQRAAFTARLLDDARKDVFLHTQVGKDQAGGSESTERSDVSSTNPVPVPPFWGTKVERDIPIDEVFALLDLNELYRLQWGGRGSGPEWEQNVREVFEPALTRLKADAKANGWLRPQAVWGLFPVQSEGNHLLVYEPESYAATGEKREIARFGFPRQGGAERLCLADYYRSVASGEVDVAAFQVVTVGDDATRRFEQLQGAGEYGEAFFVHGIAVEAAEAVAQWTHRHIREQLELSGNQGKRYSWGYGACPDLEDHEQLFKILPAREALGMDLTSAFQLLPEQSTAAIVVHHPEAKYYVVRNDGAGGASAASASGASAGTLATAG
jgi:5-methyltetrahydrofolate--homocysteine methyltransferase